MPLSVFAKKAPESFARDLAIEKGFRASVLFKIKGTGWAFILVGSGTTTQDESVGRNRSNIGPWCSKA